MRKTIHSDAGQQVAQMVRTARIEAGLTQAALADRLEITQQTLSRIETGERRVDLVELHSICNALDLHLIAFVHRYLNEQR